MLFLLIYHFITWLFRWHTHQTEQKVTVEQLDLQSNYSVIVSRLTPCYMADTIGSKQRGLVDLGGLNAIGPNFT